MKKLLLLVFTAMTGLAAADFEAIVPVTQKHDAAVTSERAIPAGRNLWRSSLVGLAAASALDIDSSWNKRELNPVLAGPGGTFGARGAALKLGMQAGLVSLEYLIIRRNPAGKLYRITAVVNFLAASVIGAVAVRNYGVPGPPSASTHP
jgi:hypothetical protein